MKQAPDIKLFLIWIYWKSLHLFNQNLHIILFIIRVEWKY